VFLTDGGLNSILYHSGRILKGGRKREERGGEREVGREKREEEERKEKGRRGGGGREGKGKEGRVRRKEERRGEREREKRRGRKREEREKGGRGKGGGLTERGKGGESEGGREGERLNDVLNKEPLGPQPIKLKYNGVSQSSSCRFGSICGTATLTICHAIELICLPPSSPKGLLRSPPVVMDINIIQDRID